MDPDPFGTGPGITVGGKFDIWIEKSAQDSAISATIHYKVYRNSRL